MKHGVYIVSIQVTVRLEQTVSLALFNYSLTVFIAATFMVNKDEYIIVVMF